MPGVDARYPTHRAPITVPSKRSAADDQQQERRALPREIRFFTHQIQIVKEQTSQGQSNPARISQIPEKRFCAERVKFRGVLKNGFFIINYFNKTSYTTNQTVCFCAGAKEIGGVRKSNSEGRVSAECGVQPVF
jgi:hypothetical protein